MNILELFQTFQTQEQALAYLEKVRWRGKPACPYCGSESIGRHASGDRASQRWQCRDCTRAFAVTIGTIFHGTHVPLRNWFLVIALMLNAKKSASAYQIARDLSMRRPTVWSMMHRIRAAMANDPRQAELLYGLVEADKTYIGGNPRKGDRRVDDKPNKRGRGSKKIPVVGVVERGRRMVAQPAKLGDLSAKGLTKFIGRFVDKAATILTTDEFGGYNRVNEMMFLAAVSHAVEYANAIFHTNKLESLWAIVKPVWYGDRRHFGREYMPLNIAEACYKYTYNRPKAGLSVTLQTVAAE